MTVAAAMERFKHDLNAFRLIKAPLALLTIIVLVGIWAATFYKLNNDATKKKDEQVANTANLAAVFENNVARTIQEIDLQLKFLREFQRNFGETITWHDIINPRYEVSAFIAQLSVIGPDGTWMTGNVALPGGATFSVADREHFKVHVNTTRDDLFISKPVIGRASKKWSIQLTRRFNNRDGSFGGVLVGSLDPTTFMSRYEALSLGVGGGMALIGSDGIIYGGSGVFAAQLGRAFVDGVLAADYRQVSQSHAGTLINVQSETVNGNFRVAAFRKLNGVPLEVVVLTTDQQSPGSIWKLSYFLVALLSSLVILASVTAVVRAQAHAHRNLALRNEMELEKQVAEASVRDRGIFLAVMSHEIRTPLNGVLGALDLIRDDNLSERARHYVNIATESGETLLELIDNILTFSKAENDKIQLAHEQFTVGQLIRSVEDTIRSAVVKSGNVIICELCPQASLRVWGDPTRLRQVLLNLLSNANKFTSAGTIRLKVEKLTQAGSSLSLRISVSDTGIGIPADKLGKIFDRFHTLDPTYSRRSDGTGLGLAICDMLVTAMGSKIHVTSEVGKGSCFSFDLTLQMDTLALSNGEIAPQVELPQSALPHQSLRILLAEDNPTNAFVAVQVLTSAGHRVTHAANGREAVNAAQQSLFDVILMDISMPEMDGLEATAAIRSSEGKNAKTPIVALTAHVFATDQERFTAAAMNGFLTKPLRKAELLKALSTATSRSAPVIEASPRITAPDSWIDTAALSEFVSDRSTPSAVKTIGIFLDELKQKVAELDRIRQAKDQKALRMLAHSNIGSAAMLGAAKLAKTSREVERACESSSDLDWAAAAELSETIERTISAFQPFCEQGALVALREPLAMAG